MQGKDLSTFGLPGEGFETCSFKTLHEAVGEVRRAHDLGLPIIPAGHGTNCAFLEPRVQAIFLKSKDLSIKAVKRGNNRIRVTVGAGMSWDDFVAHAVRRGWHGVERLSGIPGTVGAAPVQNIGAYGASLSESFESASCVNLKTLRPVTMTRSKCGFGYRSSIFNTSRRGEFLIISITLRLKTEGSVSVSDHAELRDMLPAEPSLLQVRKAVLAIRKHKLPDWRKLPNCGSFFKNPIVSKKIGGALLKKYPNAPHWSEEKDKIKFSAAWLIEQSGARKKHWGKIALSAQHALVLVNHGEKDHARLVEAIDAISSGVKRKFGIIIRPEPNLLGRFYAEEASRAQLLRG